MENANYVSAENGLDVDVDRLYVKRAIANDGPRLKRIRPAPMGRAYRYQRRISHIELALEEKGAGNGKAGLVETVGEATPAKKAAKKIVKKAPAKKAEKKKAPEKKKGPAKRPAKKK